MARLPSFPFAIAILFAFASIAIALSTSHFQTKHQKRAELGVGRTGLPLPDLFSATLEELEAGLSTGSFNSVDLVTVCSLFWIV
jgi:hypothetical protein